MKIDLEIFSPELVKIDSRSSNSTNSSGVRNPFNFRPTQKIFSFLELDSRTDLSRSYGDASKGGSGKSQVYRRIDLELVILVKQTYSLYSFQMESLFLLKDLLQPPGDVMCKLEF